MVRAPERGIELVHCLLGSLPALPIQVAPQGRLPHRPCSSSEIITRHLLYRKPARHSRSHRRTANATTSQV